MENANSQNDVVERSERAILADFVAYPKDMIRFADHFLVSSADFTIPLHRMVWDHLRAVSPDDPIALENVIINDFGFTGRDAGKKLDAFNDLRSIHAGYAQPRLHDFAMASYNRKVQEAAHRATSNIADCGNAAAIMSKIQWALESVPKPPDLGGHELEDIATTSQFGQMPEIPEDLLHVPGFIDTLADYTLSVATKPNRTLAFSGALALLAHLSGRIFTDRRDTRTNLYVIACGFSGIGKNPPRRVNRDVLEACQFDDSVFDQIATGEGVEDTLSKHPCLMFQLDEMQKMLNALRDKRNTTAIGIVKYLNEFYSTSGSSHTMRPKATAMDQCGRVIYDPSLSIYGTGIAHGIYQALTPELIEDGFLGRCLIFDTDVEGTPNKFDGDRPVLPPAVVNQAQELAARHRRIVGNHKNTPQSVPYDTGVNDRLYEIFLNIDKRKRACNKLSDHIGTALWGRAPEKVSKLALIYTISSNYTSPVITHAAVEWAWKMTETLVQRMLKRIEVWMTCGPLDEFARQVMEFLVARKGTATRRDVMRHCHSIDGKTMDNIEQLLTDRGSIQVTQLTKQSRKYTILRNN